MPRGLLVSVHYEIYQGIPVYPGHLKTVIWVHHTHEDTAPQFESDFSYTTHGILLSDHGENLANLGAVVGKRFTFVGLPLKFRAGHGSAVRAVGILDS